MEIKNIETENYLKCEISDFPNKNYFLLISSLSENINTYKPIIIYKNFNMSNPINISDDISFWHELASNEDNLDLKLNVINGTKNYLVIQTTDYEDNYYVPLFVEVKGKTLKSIQPSNDYLIIPKILYDDEEEENEIIIHLKTTKNKKFYLNIELTNIFWLKC